MQSILSTPVEQILIVIGPEGGFTEEEIDLSRTHSFRHMSLGQNTLRIETAAIAAAVLAGQCQRSLS
jgi:16S rRNA (uracil1498-N3)-methyltransferase